MTVNDTRLRYQPGDRIGGKYEVHQALAGSLGEVYLCFGLDMQMPYALKTLRELYMSEGMVAALRDEAAVWMALGKHTNIIRCFGILTLDNRPFLMLEWLSDGDIYVTDVQKWIRDGPVSLRRHLQDGALPLKLALELAVDICRGLVHMQQIFPDLVHRDLKPENVLITEANGAKITDFGMAWLAQRVGQADLGGSFPYMAPEQWLQQPLDQRTDLYAVGCLLYEMLVGSPPFKAPSIADIRRQHLNAPLPVLAIPDLPPDLPAIIAGCLAKQREDRFASAVDLLAALSDSYRRQFGEEPRVPFTYTTGSTFRYSDYVQRGAAYLDIERFTEALADADAALQLDPKRAHAYIIRGAALQGLGSSNEALVALDQAISIDPDRSLAYHHRATIAMAQGRYGAALADYNAILERNPDDGSIYFARGNLHEQLGNLAEAAADFSAAIKRNPDDARSYVNRSLIFHRLDRYGDALNDQNQALNLAPSDDLAYAARGDTYAAMGQLDAAIADFTQAITLAPRHATHFYSRGRIYWQRKQFIEALSDLDRALALDSRFTAALVQRGIVKQELKRYDEALSDYNAVIALQPDEPHAYVNRGLVFEELGAFDRALEDYAQGIERGRSDGRTYRNRAVLLMMLKRYSEAADDYSHAIVLDPGNILNYISRGLCYEQQNLFQQALDDYTSALQLDPADPDALANQGRVLHKLGRFQEAFDFTSRAASADTELSSSTVQQRFSFVQAYLAQHPNHAMTLAEQAYLLMTFAQYDQAIRDAERVLAIQPDIAMAVYVRANCLGIAKRHHEALPEFNHLLQLNPTAIAVSAESKEPIKSAVNTIPIYVNPDIASDPAILAPLNARLQAVIVYKYALTCDNLEQSDAAIESCRRAIALDSSFEAAHQLLALVYMRLKRSSEAIAAWGGAIAMHPENADNYVFRGKMFFNAGRLAEAEADITHALALNPEHVEALVTRSRIRSQQEQAEPVSFEEVIAKGIQVDRATGTFYMADPFEHYHPLGQFDAALADLNRSIVASPNHAESYHEQGRVYVQLKRFDHALLDLTQAIELEPDNANFYIDRAYCYECMAQYQESINDLNRAIRLDPANVLAYFNRGVVYYKLQRLDRAEADNLKAIQLDPTFKKAYFNLATIWSTQGRWLDAFSCCRRAAELGHEHANQLKESIKRDVREAQGDARQLAFISFQMVESENDLRQAITRFPLLVDEAFIGVIAETLAQAQIADHYQPQLRALRELAANLRNHVGADAGASPSDTVSWQSITYLQRAHTLIRQNRYQDAIDNLNRVIELEPESIKGYAFRAACHDALREYQRALDDYDQAIRIDPNNANLYADRGDTLLKVKRNTEAIANLQRAMSLNPEHSLAQTNLALAYLCVGNYEEALVLFDLDLQQRPDRLQNYNGRGFTYHLLGRYDEALADYENVLRRDQRISYTHYNRAYAYFDLGRYSHALREFRAAISLFPQEVGSYVGLGTIYFCLGLYALASDYFEKATSSQHPVTLHLLKRTQLPREHSNGEAMRQAFHTVLVAETVEEVQAAAVKSPFVLDPEFARRLEAFTDRAPALFAWSKERGLRWLRDLQAAEERMPTIEWRGSDSLHRGWSCAEYYYREGYEAYTLRNYPEALCYLSQAITYRADVAEYLLLRGQIYYETGDLINAYRDVSTAAELEPDNPEIRFWLGHVQQTDRTDENS